MMRLFPIIANPEENARLVEMQSYRNGSDSLPRLRGFLMCRRCDSCGTRIDLVREVKDRVILRCPQCNREYVFTDRK